MPIRLAVEVVGTRRTEALLRSASKAAKDLRPAFGEINARVVEPFFRRQFDTAGEAGGQRWAPLRPSTRARRLRRGGNRGGLDRPLWDMGELRASLVKTGPRSIRRITRTEYERGTAVPYAAVHQRGTGRIPARPIVPDPLPEDVLRQIEGVVADHVAGD